MRWRDLHPGRKAHAASRVSPSLFNPDIFPEIFSAHRHIPHLLARRKFPGADFNNLLTIFEK